MSRAPDHSHPGRTAHDRAGDGAKEGGTADPSGDRRRWRDRFVWIGRAAGIPLALALVAASADPGVVRVRRGETLWGLSQRFHTTVSVLQRLNRLPDDTIYAGQALLVPGPDRPAEGGGGESTYRVRPGDTVGGIAAAHGVSTAAVAQRNGLTGAMVIHPGQVLRLPRPSHRPAGGIGGPAVRHYPAAVVAAAARHRAALARRSGPSREHVRHLVRRTARRLGVEPALALAVAQQESGFRMDVVSQADAIGAMQVLPSTGAWLGREVLGRDIDLLDADDNVLAGVTLLRILTRAAPLRQAVAGYYQGLGSVRRNGMFADTERYVASVLALRHRWR